MKGLKALFLVVILVALPLAQLVLSDGSVVEVSAPAVAQTEEGMIGAFFTISIRIEKGNGK